MDYFSGFHIIQSVKRSFNAIKPYQLYVNKFYFKFFMYLDFNGP